MKVRDALVPIDFSTSSMQALSTAVAMVEPGGEVYLLHIVDAEFISRAVEEGLGDWDSVAEKLRARAQAHMDRIVAMHQHDGVHFNSLVAIGKPFSEILKLAGDLDFALIVLSIHGRHQGALESVLFGSTAEKVLRGARTPVLCVPDAAASTRVKRVMESVASAG